MSNVTAIHFQRAGSSPSSSLRSGLIVASKSLVPHYRVEPASLASTIAICLSRVGTVNNLSAKDTMFKAQLSDRKSVANPQVPERDASRDKYVKGCDKYNKSLAPSNPSLDTLNDCKATTVPKYVFLPCKPRRPVNFHLLSQKHLPAPQKP